MAKRYKKIRWKDFSGGRNQEFYDKEKEERFLKSTAIDSDINTNKLRLSVELDSQVLADHSSIDPGEEPRFNLVNYTTQGGIKYSVLLAFNSSTEKVEILRRIGFGAFSVIHSFANGSTEPSRLITYKNKLIAFYNDNNTLKADYSINSGAAWTTVVWPYGALIDHTVGQDGRLYVVDNSGKILVTNDGATWVLFYNGFDVEQRFSNIKSLDGFFYGLVYSFGAVRNSLIRFEVDDLVYLHDFSSTNKNPSMLDFDNRLFLGDVVDGVVEISFFDKGEVSFAGFIDDHDFVAVKLLYSDKDYLYITCAEAEFDSEAEFDQTVFRHIYRVNREGGIFHYYTFSATDFSSCTNIVEYVGSLLFQVSILDTGNSLVVHDNNLEKFIAQGDGVLSILDIGEHKPVYAILKHDLLPAGTDVKLYKKADKTAAWSLVLTSDTDGAVSREVKLTDDKVVFYQFKIELNTTDDTKSAENVELIYLYIPLGLENSE